MTESQLVNQILEGLLIRNLFVWRSNNMPVFDNKKGLYRKLPKFTPRGIADILGILPDGKFLAIEVKSEKGVQSEYQKIFEDNIKSRNGIYLLVRSWEEIDNKLKELGIYK